MRLSQETVREFAPILSADIIESENDFHVHVDLPGVHASDLDVQMANGFLTIKAIRRQVHENDVGFTHKIERSFGKVQRSIVIPENADVDSGEAKCVHGVLTVTFQKKNGAKPARKLIVN